MFSSRVVRPSAIACLAALLATAGCSAASIDRPSRAAFTPPVRAAGASGPAATADGPARKAFGAPESWRTAPPLTDLFAEQDLWSTRTTPFKDLAGGVKVVDAPGRSGQRAGRWLNHPRYPTISTTDVPTDWSGSAALVLDVYSARATRERVTVGVRSDNPATFAADFLSATIKVDWTGWKRVTLPESSFRALQASAEVSGMLRNNKPLGWKKITELRLLTTVYGNHPHPATDLSIGLIRLGPATKPTRVLPPPPVRTFSGVPVTAQNGLFDSSALNHTGPEVRRPGPMKLPFTHAPYGKSERAQLGYYPRYRPGTVSTDPSGRDVILADGYVLETVNSKGHWSTVDLLRQAIAPYVKKHLTPTGFTLGNRGQLVDTSVRFDTDGDVYVLASVEVTVPNPARRGLLLHGSPDLKKWTVYPLTESRVRFEKMTGHNADALDHPPVLLMTKNYDPAVISLATPIKNTDGTLTVPEPTVIGTDTIGSGPHSGEASQAVSSGNYVYVAYGRYSPYAGRAADRGVPTYVVRYDRRTGRLSAPVLVGEGGRKADGHNWPTIAIDSKGILQVIINGHHDPFVYTHTISPRSFTRWTKPVKVSSGTSYLGLQVGADDTLYSVSRSTEGSYYFKLMLHRKKPGRDWESKPIVMPYREGYNLWFHKFVINPKTGRMFLTYSSEGQQVELMRDDYEAYVFDRPDQAATMLGGGTQPILPVGTYRSPGHGRRVAYNPPSGDFTVLTSADHGDSWRPACTLDFHP
jgi:hypothetical protein